MLRLNGTDTRLYSERRNPTLSGEFLRPLAIHTVPVYQDEDGELLYGIEPMKDPPPLTFIGWANLHELEIDGEAIFFLAAKEE